MFNRRRKYRIIGTTKSRNPYIVQVRKWYGWSTLTYINYETFHINSHGISRDFTFKTVESAKSFIDILSTEEYYKGEL